MRQRESIMRSCPPCNNWIAVAWGKPEEFPESTVSLWSEGGISGEFAEG